MRNTARLPTSPASACIWKRWKASSAASDKIILEPERLERAGRRALSAAQRAAAPTRAGSPEMSSTLRFALAGVALIGLVVVLFSATFVVQQTAAGARLPVRPVARPPITQPGLYFKWPLIETVVDIDKRILDLELPTQEVIASDQKRLVVDAFTRYRVTDPLRFYQSVNNVAGANLRLTSIVNSDCPHACWRKRISAAVVRTDRSGLMQRIRDDVNRQAAGLGIEVVDVRLRARRPAGAEQPGGVPAHADGAPARSRGHPRQGLAALADHQGQGRPRRDGARAPTPPRRADELRGNGEAENNRIIAESFGRDPELLRVLPLDAGLRGARSALATRGCSSARTATFFRYFSDPRRAVQGPAADRAAVRLRRLRERRLLAFRFPAQLVAPPLPLRRSGCPALSLSGCEGRGRSARQRAAPDRGLSCLRGPRHDDARLFAALSAWRRGRSATRRGHLPPVCVILYRTQVARSIAASEVAGGVPSRFGPNSPVNLVATMTQRTLHAHSQSCFAPAHCFRVRRRRRGSHARFSRACSRLRAGGARIASPISPRT